ncbi:VIT1/CCC1 transporter family protein [uncultured Corynebacterium sp.]|uniref:VIT1/CCC1 transporter family protein n=1 Tax=uncultured Corynebacterium sp. TaxID=159447 RepID=UPI0025E9BAB2|nr:VIT1/CCC1 transporter family protein [uncultured Corynebacterium sp.]
MTESGPGPTKQDLRRWRRYLADERAEGAVYRELARKKSGEEREILLGIAEAESRHEQYWRDRLGDEVGLPQRASLRTRMTAWMARRFGSVFVLALMQSAEDRNAYLTESERSDELAQMAADEKIHAEIVRGLATRGRARMSGDFRAAIFGANDGLVSNFALVLGMYGAGAGQTTMLAAGVAGLLSGALSMAAGEYVSVTSQKELLDASIPDPGTKEALPKLDVERNELELVYRARGMEPEEAREKAHLVFERMSDVNDSLAVEGDSGPDSEDAHTEIEQGGSGLSAALSSFLCFAAGSVIPVLPMILGVTGLASMVAAAVLVGIALLCTGALVGLLSGKPPVLRALRQLAIGLGAAAVTFGLGSVFDVATG